MSDRGPTDAKIIAAYAEAEAAMGDTKPVASLVAEVAQRLVVEQSRVRQVILDYWSAGYGG